MRTETMREKHDRQAGFTLIEVVVAISILSVGLLAVASMQTAAINGNDKAYRITEGVTWAQDRLEYLLALPYDDAALSLGTDKTDPMSSSSPPNYTITYDVTGGPIANTKRITVTATRQDRGVTRSRRLSSIKSKM